MYYASEFPNAMLQGSVSYGMCHISLTAYIGGSSSVLFASKLKCEIAHFSVVHKKGYL